MKHKSAIPQLGLLLVFLLACSQSVFAKGTPIGDIMLSGRVERAGQKLINNTTLFAGDVLRTLENGAGVVRIGRGRLEVSQLSEMKIVSEKPLKIVLNSGRLDFNFPVGTAFEIVTPQLTVTPTKSLDSYSGIVTAEPKKEDRVISRKGGYSILEREVGGETKAISEGQVLIAALVAPPLPLPQGAAGTIATITQLVPEGAQVFVGRAANPRNTSTRATVNMALATGDRVVAQQGRARILFASDRSEITLQPGTDVTIQERAQPAGFVRSISQAAGSLWFSITKATGTQTTELNTPTAVAAIRGTEGQHDINFDDETTFSLTEGETLITENITGSSVTLRAGQTVTAIRGIGFSAITALIAAVGPSIGGAGPGGAGGAGAGTGGTAGATTGATTGATAGTTTGATTGATTAATATTTTAASAAASTVSTITSALVATVPAVSAGVAATVITSQQEDPPPASSSEPLSPPGTLG